MKFDQFETEDRRLVMLRGLAAAAQYRANALLLRHYCASLGHAVSADRIEQDIAWLAEQGLVDSVKTHSITVATATQRGLDVADGSTTVPGVKRPVPGA